MWQYPTMKIHIGSDHAGFELKAEFIKHLESKGHEVIDHGPTWYDAIDDYPPFCLRAAEAVATDAGSLGIVLGGSGNGEQMAANKVLGIRAALAWNPNLAVLSREHNNANVVSVGARMHTTEEAIAIIDAFISTPYSNEERHTRRIDMLSQYEKTRVLPPMPEGH